MIRSFRKNKGISLDDWNKLTTHKHKLIDFKKQSLEDLKKIDEETMSEINKEYDNYFQNVDRKSLMNAITHNITAFSHFTIIKENCLYLDWNDKTNNWDEFVDLDKEKQRDLAYFFMKLTQTELHLIKMSIEFAVNVIRRDRDFVNLPYPKYNEFHEFKDFEFHNLEDPNLDFQKESFNRGRDLMDKFIISRDFEILRNISLDIIFDYVSQAQKMNINDWEPHPLLRAIMLGLKSAEEMQKDGNYAGMSGDAEFTEDGNPTMITNAIVSKKDSMFTIEKVAIGIGNHLDEYDMTDEMIEKIFKADMLISKHPTNDVPIEIIHQSFAAIHLKLKKFPKKFNEQAVQYTKTLSEKGELQGKLPDDIIEGIKKAENSKWDDLDPIIRLQIAMLYSIKIGMLSPTEFLITGYEDTIPKHIIRRNTYIMLKTYLNYMKNHG